MNRRRFLAWSGLVGSLGLVGARRRSGERPLAVRVWFSERASTHDGIEPRVVGYLERAISGARGSAAVSVGDRSIRLDAEGGARLVEVEWPGMVVAGAVGRGPVRPTADANLLVTDGDPDGSPPGYGMRGIAALGGAHLLASLPPADDAPTVVRRSPAASMAQLLHHECGHALGLEHRHGSVRSRATPSSPARWSAATPGPRTRCGGDTSRRR